MQYIESEAKLGASPVAITGWEDQVKLSATYSAIRIGGIRDVVVTVNNQWCCKIEELIVSVHYIKENGEEFDVERITLRHIEQGETKIQTAKGARRGSNINLSIYEIHSKEGHVDYRTFE